MQFYSRSNECYEWMKNEAMPWQWHKKNVLNNNNVLMKAEGERKTCTCRDKYTIDGSKYARIYPSIYWAMCARSFKMIVQNIVVDVDDAKRSNTEKKVIYISLHYGLCFACVQHMANGQCTTNVRQCGKFSLHSLHTPRIHGILDGIFYFNGKLHANAEIQYIFMVHYERMSCISIVCLNSCGRRTFLHGRCPQCTRIL